MIRKLTSIFASLLALSFILLSVTALASAKKPNIMLIMVDDMGWSDLGSFGSEIGTPHLDALAQRGTKFTNFHTSVSCSPTRSMLLSGTDNHLASLRCHQLKGFACKSSICSFTKLVYAIFTE
jgi:hypothetical protein